MCSHVDTSYINTYRHNEINVFKLAISRSVCPWSLIELIPHPFLIGFGNCARLPNIDETVSFIFLFFEENVIKSAIFIGH